MMNSNNARDYKVSLLAIFLSLVSYSSTAQLIDTIKADLTRKPVFNYKIDSRGSFVNNKSSNIWGIKFGVNFNKRTRFGIGYNYLKSRNPAGTMLYSPDAKGYVQARLRWRYVSFYAEYVYYRKNKWELSVPVQLGVGSMRYVPYTSQQAYVSNGGSKLVLLYEPCLSVNYRILPFASLGTEMGLRVALYKNKMFKEQLTAPIYVFKMSIYWADMINFFWPNNKVPACIMDYL